MNIPPRLRLALWILGVAAFLVAAWYLLEHVPQETASQIRGDTPARLEAFNAARTTGAQIFLGLGIFVGLYLTYRRLKAVEDQARTAAEQAQTAARQAKTAEDGQITERLSRAIEQLGAAENDQMAIRLGGIYALERILRDSEADAPTIQEVLGAFVREEASRHLVEALPPEISPGSKTARFPLDTDLKAALSVLGRNPLPNQWPDLRGTNFACRDLSGLNLENLNFEDAELEGADFTRARLAGARLVGARLTGARLSGADLSGSKLSMADLPDANLTKADLSRTELFMTDLSGARLIGANLTEAHLDSADFTGADLFKADLTGAIGGDLSRVRRLPDGSRPPARDADAQ